MQEQIGKVTIQYREEEILLQTEALEDARIRELLAEGYDCRQQQSPDWPVLYHLSHLRANSNTRSVFFTGSHWVRFARRWDR